MHCETQKPCIWLRERRPMKDQHFAFGNPMYITCGCCWSVWCQLLPAHITLLVQCHWASLPKPSLQCWSGAGATSE